MNNLIYLRIEQGDLIELCSSLISDLYDVENVLLICGGFKISGKLK